MPKLSASSKDVFQYIDTSTVVPFQGVNCLLRLAYNKDGVWILLKRPSEKRWTIRPPRYLGVDQEMRDQLITLFKRSAKMLNKKVTFKTGLTKAFEVLAP